MRWKKFIKKYINTTATSTKTFFSHTRNMYIFDGECVHPICATLYSFKYYLLRSNGCLPIWNISSFIFDRKYNNIVNSFYVSKYIFIVWGMNSVCWAVYNRVYAKKDITLLLSFFASKKLYVTYSFFFLLYMVPRRGFEPPRDYSHTPLKRACLPISPPGHITLLLFLLNYRASTRRGGIIYYGAPDRSRTYNQWLRRPLLYPIELRVHMPKILALALYEKFMKLQIFFFLLSLL